MADYLTNTTELTAVADAIRAKGGTTASLVYPNGFVSAIENISGGGSASGLLVTITVYANSATADKTAQEIYDAVTAGIQPVIKYSDNYYPPKFIYTNGSRLTLSCPSAVSGDLVANSMSDYPSYSGGGGGND